MLDLFLIAKIKSVVNEDGYLSIKSYSDFPERFYELEKVYIDVFGEKRKFLVEDVKYFKRQVVLKFVNFDSDEDLDFLVGKSIYVDKENVVKLDKDSFFIHDLIDSAVYVGEELFGSIKDVINLPSNDVFVINDRNGKEVLIPAVKDFIEKIDIKNKSLYVKPDFEEDDDED
ncbi:MAG: 16S rRNA processing protein RimM [Melioribacteraceae bacterium]|nr:16S rRNA processing protein RimM [Melioribacteraceae bacterium]